MSRMLSEVGSLCFSQLSSTSMESLPHEQAGARTYIYSINIWGPIILNLPCLGRASTLWARAEWGNRALYLLAAFVQNSASARQNLEGWEMLAAFSSRGDTVVSDKDLEQDKAPSSWPHRTRMEFLLCWAGIGERGNRTWLKCHQCSLFLLTFRFY